MASLAHTRSFNNHFGVAAIDTLNALDETLLAALILMYVHEGRFDAGVQNSDAAQAVVDLTSISLARLQDGFADLEGSFIKRSSDGWTFSHPTIADALTEILRQKPHMMAALLLVAALAPNANCWRRPPPGFDSFRTR